MSPKTASRADQQRARLASPPGELDLLEPVVFSLGAFYTLVALATLLRPEAGESALVAGVSRLSWNRRKAFRR